MITDYWVQHLYRESTLGTWLQNRHQTCRDMSIMWLMAYLKKSDTVGPLSYSRDDSSWRFANITKLLHLIPPERLH